LAQLDAQACFQGTSSTGQPQQQLLCAPNTVSAAAGNNACPVPNVTPDIVASGKWVSPPPSSGPVLAAEYLSGGTISGTEGETCVVNSFNNGSVGASGILTLTGSNTIASGTQLQMTTTGSGATAAPTSATLGSGTATCSGTVSILSGPILGAAGQTCNLSTFNNGSVGATATVTLTGPNAIAATTPLTIVTGGIGATASPTQALLTSGTAVCAGAATVSTTLTPNPTCPVSVGTLSFQVGNSSIASINAATNQITAEQPGTTPITASISGSGSSAGYFSVCPPQSIVVHLANGNNSGTITQGVQQNLETTVTDTNGNIITGLSLDYQSTDPIDISAASGGGISTRFPGVASIFAVCQPSSCNPSPINVTGLNGTGLSVASNPVTITTPGTASDYVFFAAPGQSQYYASIELLTGNAGSTIRLPYVPNSMIMDLQGESLYFGSTHGLMIYGTTTNALSKSDTSVPGVVLAVAPDDAQLLINDQIRQVFYVYNVGNAGSSTSFAGMGTSAEWTPDSKTLYITDTSAANNPAEGITGHTDMLYVYNQNSGWTTYPLPAPSNTQVQNQTPRTLALTIPSVGAYISGQPTTAHTWCPTGIAGNFSSTSFYPVGDSVPVPTDVLAATTDGQHILGATKPAGGQPVLYDIGVSIPTSACPVTTTGSGATQVQTLNALPIPHSPATPTPQSIGVDATAVNQVVISPSSSLAFITYNGSVPFAQLPYYKPGASGSTGTVGYVTLTGNASITSPLAGAFTPDNSLFFVSTDDNKIHFISVQTLTDTQQYSPDLPACNPAIDSGCTLPSTNTNTVVPATKITVVPRNTT
jgi:hypothetical protein